MACERNPKGDPSGCIGCTHICFRDSENYCDTPSTQSKNLTKVIRHPYLKRDAAVYERDDTKWGEHVITRMPGGGPEYLAGPVIDRLHEFEKLGYEPEQLQRIIDKNKYYKIIANCHYGAYGTLTNRSLYEAFRKAGDEELKKCDDIKSMYPSTLFTEAGFEYYYQKYKEFKRLVDERISRAILDAPSKLYISTAGDSDSLFTKKLKEYGEMLRKGMELGLANPMPLKHQFKAMFNYQDTDSMKIDWEKSKKEFLKQDMEMMKKYCEADWAITQAMIEKAPKPLPKIDKVTFNNPATIVFWDDGEKTVVKAQNGEPYDPEKGLAMAIAKRALGNNRAYYEEFSKHLGRGRKHFTPEQYNSEVCHINEYEELHQWCCDEMRGSAMALIELRSVMNDKKATKADIVEAVNKAMEYLSPDNKLKEDN